MVSSTTPSGWPASASAPADRSTSQPARSTTPTPCRSSPVSTSQPTSSEPLAAPAWIDNDAVVAGLAETHWGQAGATESLLCVTLGTGIGAVLIEAGRPRRAADGQHPEAGHIPVAGTGNPCYCGLPQCWEQVASRTALDRLRRSGELEDSALWSEYAERVASGLIALVTLYHPACIVIGGSVSQHWADLEGPLRDALSRFREFDRATRLEASTLGERAGALGAALLPQRGIGWHHSHLDEPPGHEAN